MEAFSIVRPLLHTTVQYVTIALILLLVVRLFMPPRTQLGTESLLSRLSRLTDPIVLPIHSMLPYGTSLAVAAILSIFAAMLVAYFFLGIVDDLLASLFGFLGGLMAGAPIQALGYLMYGAVSIFTTLVILRILFSWIRVGYNAGGKITRFVYDTTEPILAIFRGLLPSFGGIDFSPIVLFFLLGFVKNAIRSLLL